MIYNLGGLLINSSDKIIISTLLGLKQLGYYGIASMTLNFLMQVPGASREVVESKLIEHMEENKENAVKLYVLRPLTVTAYLIPFFIGSGVLLLPDTVAFFLPTYLPGVQAAQIILLGGFPLALSYVLRGGIVACNIQFAASLTMAVSALFNFLFSYLLVRKGWGINGVAFSSALSFSLLFFLQQALLTKKLQLWSEKKILSLLLPPFIFMLFFCFVAREIFIFFNWLPIIENIGAVFLYCFLMRFVYNIAARRTGEFRPIGLAIRNKIDIH
jgi:O-antigen/teichoic acid export membrane protein